MSEINVNNEDNINKSISLNENNNNISSLDNNNNISNDDNNYNENNFSDISENSFENNSEFLDFILKKDEY